MLAVASAGMVTVCIAGSYLAYANAVVVVGARVMLAIVLSSTGMARVMLANASVETAAVQMRATILLCV